MFELPKSRWQLPECRGGTVARVGKPRRLVIRLFGGQKLLWRPTAAYPRLCWLLFEVIALITGRCPAAPGPSQIQLLRNAYVAQT